MNTINIIKVTFLLKRNSPVNLKPVTYYVETNNYVTAEGKAVIQLNKDVKPELIKYYADVVITELNIIKKEIILERIEINRAYFDDCTIGRGNYKGFNFCVLELPDLDNKQNVSCIPDGIYKAKKRISPGKGYEVIEFINVPNRTYIQAHYGNYTRQLLGCQLYGDGLKYIDGDDIIDITNSEKTIKKLLSMLPDNEEFEIEIT